MSEYFDSSTDRVVAHTAARASDVNAIIDKSGAGFDKLPAPEDIMADNITYFADVGTANNYAVTTSYHWSSYKDGMQIVFDPANNNTSNASLNVDSLGAKAIKRPDGSDVIAGDIVTGQIVALRYNGTNFVYTGSAPVSFYNEAATSATNAANSESAALTSANNAATSEANASSSETAAASSESNAESSKNAAASSATSAASSATSASNSATSAANSASGASTSATNAANSESAAEDSKDAAATSAANALSSRNSALASASNASTSSTDAADSKNAAAASETNAANSASTASTAATNASSSASAASTSATNAANSASAASTSATNAANSADDAADSVSSVQPENIIHTQGSGLDNELLTYLKTIDGAGSGLEAETATKLTTSRTISLTGDVSGSASFDGSANASIPAIVANNSHNHDASTVSSCAGNSATATKLATARAISLSGDVSGSANFDGSSTASIVTTVSDNSHRHDASTVSSCSGNAANATKLATPRTISLNGDVSGSVPFDGTSDVSITTIVANNSHTHEKIVHSPNSATFDGSGGAIRVTTATGYVDIGSMSSTTADLVTNRDKFKMNVDLYIGTDKVFHQGNVSGATGIDASTFQGQNDNYYRCANGCSWTCSTNCTGSCMSGCTGCSSCEGGCTGCSGTCEGTCSGGCTGGCSSCTGGCTGSCDGGCEDGCGSGCDGCSGV